MMMVKNEGYSMNERTLLGRLVSEAMAGDTKRDVWEVAGFPESISFEALYRMYARSGLGNAVVTRPVTKCWSTLPKIYDCGSDGEAKASNTKFEQELKFLIENKGFMTALAELDEYQRIGRYAGVVIVAKEKDKKAPAEDLKVQGYLNIIGFRPCFEGDLEPSIPEDDFGSENYGNPKVWNYKPNLTLSKQQRQLDLKSFDIHHTRVFAFSENASGNSVFGLSPLEIVFNGLSSATKTLVAGSEGLFKNAKQPININVSDQDAAKAVMSNPQLKKELDQNIEDFGNSFTKELLTWGADVKTLSSTMIDPSNTFDMCVKEVSAGSEIPSTELIANEVGQLAGTENANAWNTKCNSRRENKLTPMIVAFIKHLISIGAMSRPSKGIRVVWDDLNSRSDKGKLELAQLMATVNQTMFNAGSSEQVFTSEEIRTSADYADVDEGDLEGLDDDDQTT